METQSSTTNELSERLCGGFGKGETTITAFSSLVYYSFDLEMWRQFRERLAAHEMDISMWRQFRERLAAHEMDISDLR